MDDSTPMNKETALSLVKDFLVNRFEIDEEQVRPEALFFEDLGMDSIDALDMIAIIESELKVSVDEAEARKIRTVDDAADFIVTMHARGVRPGV